ncbi:MAG TPA: CBS domain-containing protein [Nitrospinaceae bacterium]|jgi:CBS domain-containing protein|nr:CBS domain-containing protein [Nitrospinaceae bacterium]
MKNLEKFTVNPDTNIHDALKIIDRPGGQIALVVDRTQKLMGTVTDGDVRI